MYIHYFGDESRDFRTKTVGKAGGGPLFGENFQMQHSVNKVLFRETNLEGVKSERKKKLSVFRAECHRQS